jgi:hypothetical protein
MPDHQRIVRDRLLYKALEFGLILVLALGSAKAAEHCTLAHPLTCSNTNELVWNKSFQKEVRAFLFAQHGDYAVRGETVSNQALDVLGGPPDSRKTLDDLVLFGACMFRNCGEKGAALLDLNGRVEAIGMLDACNSTHKPLPNCFLHMTLTTFVREDDHRKAAIAAMSDWAREAIAAENNAKSSVDLGTVDLDRVQVIDIELSR